MAPAAIEQRRKFATLNAWMYQRWRTRNDSTAWAARMMTMTYVGCKRTAPAKKNTVVV